MNMKKFGVPPEKKFKLYAFTLLNKDISFKIGKIEGNTFSWVNISLETYPDGLIAGNIALFGWGIDLTCI